MRVFNLTGKDLHFRKSVLPANGGYKDFPELDSFIPDNDKELAEAKVISFEELPKWWIAKKKESSSSSDNSGTAVDSSSNKQASKKRK